MSVVCFTGRGYNAGNFVVRDAWIEMASRMGWHYTEDAARATYLVASRTDTSKARNARLSGTQVITYDQFLARYRDHLLQGRTATGRTSSSQPNYSNSPMSVPASELGRDWLENFTVNGVMVCEVRGGGWRVDGSSQLWTSRESARIAAESLARRRAVQPVAPANPVFGGRRAINLDED